jgi:hypothetical protein
MENNEKFKKEDLEDLILKQQKSYRQIGLIYGVSDTYIKKISKKLGVDLPVRSQFKNGFKSPKEGMGKKITCLSCNKTIKQERKQQLYCNRNCYYEHHKNKHYLFYIDNQDLFCDANKHIIFVKKHIMEEQNCCCGICGCSNEWNGKELVFILDHIDGNAANNKRDNLRLVCPNCDSQLLTYKSKNKNSARKERYLKNYK